MSFDQDPNEQANISGADLAIMCDEINALRAEVARLTATAPQSNAQGSDRQLLEDAALAIQFGTLEANQLLDRLHTRLGWQDGAGSASALVNMALLPRVPTDAMAEAAMLILKSPSDIRECYGEIVIDPHTPMDIWRDMIEAATKEKP